MVIQIVRSVSTGVENEVILSSLWYVWSFEHAHGIKRYNDKKVTRGQTTSGLVGTARLEFLLPYFILTIFIAVFPNTVATVVRVK